ncbi:hypothetical protein ATI61_11089 [Archangium gephyra]|uniref:Uncharacterized protein n=1 Tax=Archangium gephyra TaxID=48 RepID=A0AAC8TJ07_9BACT|nr:hypothetical protein [Archangium gephyra]AKJ06166.1 Hypothetical protein AA314_07792 [Archangium gephyra]REG27082.1 hypothetical protein ATI61_11089 [Archangium gephyra]
MHHQTLTLLILTTALVIVFFIIWYVHKVRVAAWAEFANRHGMHADGLELEGTYEGYPMRLETQSRGSGKNQYRVTVLHLSTNGALPPEFSLEPEGLGDKLLKLFGKGDEELGDEQFDKRFDLSNLTASATEVLRHPSVQQHLYEMLSYYRAFHIREGWIQAEQRDIPSTADALEELTGPALMLAHTLEEAAGRTQGRTAG